jgi:nicotinamide mononucleotide adenylyltransferase
MSEIKPKRGSSALFTFGRFQPPTTGHQILIESVASAAAEGADAYIFVTSSSNNLEAKVVKNMMKNGEFKSVKENENPLSVDAKVFYLKKMYPETEVTFINTTEHDCRQLPQVLERLRSAGYTSITMMVGSDRVPAFKKMFEKAAPDVKVISAGERNLANAVSNAPKAMSGTKMRLAAVRGDFDFFKRGVMIGDMTEADAKDLMGLVRVGLGFPAALEGGGRRKIRVRPMTRRRYRLRENERL